jgi:hypothetical protein
VLGISEDFLNPFKNRIAVDRQHVVEPVERLDNAHRRSARPVWTVTFAGTALVRPSWLAAVIPSGRNRAFSLRATASMMAV